MLKRYTGISLLNWIALIPAVVIAGTELRNSEYPSGLSFLTIIDGPVVALFLWLNLMSVNRWLDERSGRN